MNLFWRGFLKKYTCNLSRDCFVGHVNVKLLRSEHLWPFVVLRRQRLHLESLFLLLLMCNFPKSSLMLWDFFLWSSKAHRALQLKFVRHAFFGTSMACWSFAAIKVLHRNKHLLSLVIRLGELAAVRGGTVPVCISLLLVPASSP